VIASRPTAAALLALLVTVACGRDPGPTAEETAYRFRDIYPYPAITGGGAEGESGLLAPLRPGYLVYIEGQDFDAAAAEFARVAAAYPDLTEARLLQGISLVLGGRTAEAIPVLEDVVAQYGGFPAARWFLGQALFSEGRTDEALQQMRAVRDLDGEYADWAAEVLAAGDRHRR
jgi:tetratricopeptide (TPR) repeat protein